MGNIGKATEPRSINNQWQPTQVTDIYLVFDSPSIDSCPDNMYMT